MTKREIDVVLLKRALKLLLFLACLFEIIFFPTLNSLVLCFVSIGSLLIFNRFVFTLRIIRQYPVCFFVLLNIFLFMYLPIPATLFDAKPADESLFMPKTTYVLQFLYYVITIMAFRFAIASKKHTLSSRLKRWGYFPKPTPYILWFLGLIGCIPRLTLMVTDLDLGQGLLNTLSFFMYAPICLLFMQLFGAKPSSKKQRIFVIFYLIAIEILLMGTNGRHYMITPFIIIFAGFIFSYFYDESRESIFSVKKIVLTVIVFLFISGPFADVATAMVIVRSQRADVSFVELIKLTYETSLDKKTLALAREADKLNNEYSSMSTDWNEYYVSNVFLSRFCNYRVVDASIYHALRAGVPNSYMQEKALLYLLSLPPNPIPALLFHIDKNVHFSQMDYLYAKSMHQAPWAMLRVGGDVGLGLATYGLFYFFVILIIYVFLFKILKCVILLSNGKALFSIFMMIQAMEFFNIFTVHSGPIKFIAFIIWNFWWSTFIMLLVYKVIRNLFIHTK